MVAQGTFSTGLIQSYCRPEDLTALLAGYDLSRLGDAQALAERTAALLPVTRRAVEAAAGRDFAWHGSDTVCLDGRGTDRLSLTEAGTAPVVTVTEVRLNGQIVPASNYVVYPQAGDIRLVSPPPAGGSGLPSFPVGRQNVIVTLDWGYEQPPAEVGLAQAKLTAAELLAEATGETAAATGMSLGDYAVRYAAGGKYGVVIQRLIDEAQELLRPYRRLRMRAV